MYSFYRVRKKIVIGSYLTFVEMRRKILANVSTVLYQRERKKNLDVVGYLIIEDTESPEKTSEITTSLTSTPTQLPPPPQHLTTHPLF